MKRILLFCVSICLISTNVIAQDDEGPRSGKYLGPPLAPGELAMNYSAGVGIGGALTTDSFQTRIWENDNASDRYYMERIILPAGTTLKRILFYAVDNSDTANITISLRSRTQKNNFTTHISKSTAGVASSANFRFFQTGAFSHQMLEYRSYFIVIHCATATPDATALQVSQVRLIYEPVP